MTISILKAERFYPLGKPIQRPAKDDSKKDGEQVRPGIWRKPDGTLGDGWIDIGAETPDLQAGCYEWRNKTALVAHKAQRLSIRDLFNEADFGTYQYRLIPTEAA